jgi:hypothetical protein
MQKIILMNDKQNKIAQDITQKLLVENRQKLITATFEEQDYIISEIIKLQNQYFQIKAEEGYFLAFDDFLKYSKLSLNIIFDYLYKKDGSIRINISGTKMLINFCYELITENKNKNNEEISFKDIKNIPECHKDIPQNILLLDREDFIKNNNKKHKYRPSIEDDDDDDDFAIPPWHASKKDNYKEANQAYFLLIEFLLKTLEDETDPIWSWQ